LLTFTSLYYRKVMKNPFIEWVHLLKKWSSYQRCLTTFRRKGTKWMTNATGSRQVPAAAVSFVIEFLHWSKLTFDNRDIVQYGWTVNDWSCCGWIAYCRKVRPHPTWYVNRDNV
jgi:hypothetical protein